MAYATRLIQPNEQNPNTVYLLPGVYSKELNNQFFPVAIQSNTNLLGAGETPADVMIGEEWNLNTVSIWFADNVEVGFFHMKRNDVYNEQTMGMNRCQNVKVRDVDFGEAHTDYPGLLISRSETIEIANCNFHNIIGYYGDFECLRTYRSEVHVNNIIINNNTSTSDDGHVSGIDFGDCTITANNIIVTNNYQDYPGVLVQYGNTGNSSPGEYLKLSNFLMYNNTSSDNTLPLAIFFNKYDHSYISNMTIAHNSGPTGILRLAGDYTIRNSIMYNPDASYEAHIWSPSSGESNPTYSNIDINYCLIRNGESGMSGADNPNNTLTWGEHNFDTDPLFRGDVTGDIPVGDFRWLQLTENSPCVDAGTPDTLGMNIPTVDIGGNTRVWGGIIDMGAWEYNATPNNEETVPAQPRSIVVSHFPNPVILNSDKSGCAFIEFTLPKKPIEKPTLEIYNIRGQKVRSIRITQSLSALVRSAGLSTEEKQSGEKYSQIWDCRDDNRKLVTSGIYFYKVRSEGKEALGKIMVLK
jgi:hypothetical protein